MSGIEVYNALLRIGATRSAKAKAAIIDEYKENELFKKVLDYALNPFKTYGVAKLTDIGAAPVPTTPPSWTSIKLEEASVWDTLDKMVSRALTGNAAIDAVDNIRRNMDAEDRFVFERVLLKDLKIGASAKTINKVIPDLIPTFDCMLAQKFEETRVKRWPWMCEPKKDGFRVFAFVNFVTESVKFFSRKGIEYTVFEHLKKPILEAFGKVKHSGVIGDYVFKTNAGVNTTVVLDGEMVSGSFAKTSSELRKKDEQAKDARFGVFDVVPLSLFEGSDKDDKEAGTQADRRKILEAYLTKDDSQQLHILPCYWVNSMSEVKQYYLSFRNAGLEGAMIKNPKARYQRKRSYDWLKMKNEATVDIPVIGYFKGEPGTKYENCLGGLIGNHMGVPVRVGGGFSDDQRKEFFEACQKDEEMAKSEDADDYVNQVLGRAIEVEYHEETPDGSLRHPRFVRFRDDKPLDEEDDDTDE